MRLRIWTVLGALAGAFSLMPAALAQSGRLPDFTELYEQQGPAVVSIDVTQTARRQAMPEISEDDPFYEFFRRFGQIPRGAAAPARLRAAVDRLGLHPGRRRLRADQRPRRRRCQRSHGQADRQARIPGQGHRHRQAHRCRAAQDRGHRTAQGDDRRSRQAQGRRMGRGDRQAVRPREHDHRRHRQRQGARAAERKSRPVHPDRRADQSGQLRRPAVQSQRRGGRHQLADLQPDRRLHGARLRDSDRRGDERRQADPGKGPRDPRPDRRADPGSQPRDRRRVRPRQGQRRAGELGREGRPGRQGGHRGGRHHHQGRRPDGEHLVRAAAHHHPGQAGHQDRRCSSGARARPRTSPSPSPSSRRTRRRGPCAALRRARKRPSPIAWGWCCRT